MTFYRLTKMMTPYLFGALFIGFAITAQAVVVQDDFNRGDTSWSTDPSMSIGTNWINGGVAGNSGTFRIADQRLLTGGGSGNVPVIHAGVETVSGGGADFTLSTTVRLTSDNIYGNLVFNYQNPTNYYAVRFRAASKAVQVVRVVDGNPAAAFAIVANTNLLDFTNPSDYEFQVASDAPYTFDIVFREMASGETMEFTATDSVAHFSGGLAGVMSSSSGTSFDDFRLEVMGEASTIRLPAIFADHMVLQRQTENPVWGWATPNDEISVTFAGETVSTFADANGRWQVTLPAFEKNAIGQPLAVQSSDGSTHQISDVLIGEVWFYSGPSNIKHALQHCTTGAAEVAAANYPGIRFFTVPFALAHEPQEDCAGVWTVCSAATASNVSGVAYFLSRRIHLELDVPVAALQSFQGGTRMESWTSAAAVEGNPALEPVAAWWQQAVADFDLEAARQAYNDAIAQWELDVIEAEANGDPLPPEPPAMFNPVQSIDRPGRLFNAMIAPIIPYGIRGAATYPGLGNLYWAEYGEALITTMIQDWRQRWGRGDFPVAMIQPAPFPTDDWKKQVPEAYPLLREAQIRVVQRQPHVGLAPTLDIVNLINVHYPNKQEVGHRLALWALSKVYGLPYEHGGPLYDVMAVEGEAVRITFSNTGSGLKTSDGQPPSAFTIAGRDGVFVSAEAVIEGDTVLVQSASVPYPLAVRLAWNDTDTSNLVNGNDLPVSLFRTDRLLTLFNGMTFLDGHIQMAFRPEHGETYRLYYTTDLTTEPLVWTLTDSLISTNNNGVLMDNTAADPMRIYRLVVE